VTEINHSRPGTAPTADGRCGIISMYRARVQATYHIARASSVSLRPSSARAYARSGGERRREHPVQGVIDGDGRLTMETATAWLC